MHGMHGFRRRRRRRQYWNDDDWHARKLIGCSNMIETFPVGGGILVSRLAQCSVFSDGE